MIVHYHINYNYLSINLSWVSLSIPHCLLSGNNGQLLTIYGKITLHISQNNITVLLIADAYMTHSIHLLPIPCQLYVMLDYEGTQTKSIPIWDAAVCAWSHSPTKGAPTISGQNWTCQSIKITFCIWGLYHGTRDRFEHFNGFSFLVVFNLFHDLYLCIRIIRLHWPLHDIEMSNVKCAI